MLHISLSSLTLQLLQAGEAVCVFGARRTGHTRLHPTIDPGKGLESGAGNAAPQRPARPARRARASQAHSPCSTRGAFESSSCAPTWRRRCLAVRRAESVSVVTHAAAEHVRVRGVRPAI